MTKDLRPLLSKSCGPSHMSILSEDYSESKYSVESVSGKYLENGWSDQHRDFTVEFVVEKLTTLFFCT